MSWQMSKVTISWVLTDWFKKYSQDSHCALEGYVWWILFHATRSGYISSFAKRKVKLFDLDETSSRTNKFSSFLESYAILDRIRRIRWVSFRADIQIEHHVFCLRNAFYRTIKVHLLTAKTCQVAPVKTISLPRLELCDSALWDVYRWNRFC